VQPKIYFIEEHGIDPTIIDPDAKQVMSRLREAGFTAYMVGGSVRDLLTKRTPKDYDISTSARPEQIKQIFQRNCILIGRRFRLAHIRYGHKIFEVSTFRAGDTTESDLIVHDNTWGSPEEDARRRDFTINGLFYDTSNHTIIDYVGGWQDIQKRILRTIGDPWNRFKQDPVRMIRLLKFRARLGFDIAPLSRRALIGCRQEIVKSAPARILEEFFRMLESGAAMSFFVLMSESGLLDLLFPALADLMKQEMGQTIYRYLAAADRIHSKGHLKQPLDRSVLTACLLFPILDKHLSDQKEEILEGSHYADVMKQIAVLFREYIMSSFTHFPRRITATAAFIMTLQQRLTPPGGKRHHRPKILRNKEFHLALTFLKIRALVNEKYLEDYTSWKEYYRQSLKQNDRKHSHSSPNHKRPAQVKRNSGHGSSH
jgi:poly(A) polymerase